MHCMGSYCTCALLCSTCECCFETLKYSGYLVHLSRPLSQVGWLCGYSRFDLNPRQMPDVKPQPTSVMETRLFAPSIAQTLFSYRFVCLAIAYNLTMLTSFGGLPACSYSSRPTPFECWPS